MDGIKFDKKAVKVVPLFLTLEEAELLGRMAKDRGRSRKAQAEWLVRSAIRYAAGGDSSPQSPQKEVATS